MLNIPQDLDLWRRIDYWCVKVISIGTGNSDSNSLANGKLVGRGQKIENKFHRLSGWDWFEFALKMIMPGQTQIVERSLAKGTV